MNARFLEPLAHSQSGMDQTRIIALGGDDDGRISLGEVVVQRGNEPPLYRHRHEDVFVYVVAGRLTFHIDDRRFAAVPGSCVVIPRGSEQGYAIESDTAHLLVMLTPPGAESCLPGLYGAAHAMAAVLDDAAPGADFERLVTTAARHGIDITGPPLTREAR